MLNIVTPCSRFNNLSIIEKSINIPKSEMRWIIVFDRDSIPDVYIPSFAEIYCHTNPLSIVGHAQRNFALDLIDNGHIYFNDDDTIIHPDLWSNIEYKLSDYDFISFDQSNKDGSPRLKGNNITLHQIDSHNFITKKILSKNIRFHIDKYDADGYFAIDCYKQSKSPLYISKTLSIYNSLR